MIDFETLAARSLNGTRVIHRPTYAGLRLFLESARKNPNALLSFLPRRIAARNDWRYFLFPLLKEAAEGKDFSYREECLVGSPLTAFAESYVLALMAASKPFQPSPCVYSYLWPKKDTVGRNFTYFFEGYVQRNRHAASMLRRHHDHVAVVSDLRNFYPSVDTGLLKRRVSERTSQMTDAAHARVVRQFIDGLLKESRRGIPVGPDLSHALGQIALDALDQTMQSYYGDCYLRYVDDIIIICPRSEVARAKERLKRAVESEGLELHEGKQDEVGSNAWLSSDPLLSTEPDPFQVLTESILLYLVQNPRRSDPLRQAFESEGFSLPLRRLGGLAKSARYHAYLQIRVLWKHGPKAWLRSLVWESPQTLIAQAHDVRRSLQTLCQMYAKENPPGEGMKRRWYVQKRRHALNRLLYLLPPSDYGPLLSSFPRINELAESRLVAQAISDGDVTQILRCPGRAVGAFCQLWSEREGNRTPKVVWPNTLTWIEIESMAQMQLYFKLDPPERLISELSERAPGGRILFEIISGHIGRPSIERNSYLDEMNMLLRGVSPESMHQIMTSRFDTSENDDSGLDLLHLGGTMWSP